MPSAEAITPPMDWEEAGRAWGARPADWACLFEPYARPNEVIFDQLLRPCHQLQRDLEGMRGGAAGGGPGTAPGGRLGLTFWGRLEHLGLTPYFLKAIELSPPSHGEATVRQGDTGRPV